jgi:hypothetical protein
MRDIYDEPFSERDRRTTYEATETGKVHAEREKKVERLINVATIIRQESTMFQRKPDGAFLHALWPERLQELRAALDALKGNA